MSTNPTPSRSHLPPASYSHFLTGTICVFFLTVLTVIVGNEAPVFTSEGTNWVTPWGLFKEAKKHISEYKISEIDLSKAQEKKAKKECHYLVIDKTVNPKDTAGFFALKSKIVSEYNNGDTKEKLNRISDNNNYKAFIYLLLEVLKKSTSKTTDVELTVFIYNGLNDPENEIKMVYFGDSTNCRIRGNTTLNSEYESICKSIDTYHSDIDRQRRTDISFMFKKLNDKLNTEELNLECNNYLHLFSDFVHEVEGGIEGDVSMKYVKEEIFKFNKHKFDRINLFKFPCNPQTDLQKNNNAEEVCSAILQSSDASVNPQDIEAIDIKKIKVGKEDKMEPSTKSLDFLVSPTIIVLDTISLYYDKLSSNTGHGAKGVVVLKNTTKSDLTVSLNAFNSDIAVAITNDSKTETIIDNMQASINIYNSKNIPLTVKNISRYSDIENAHLIIQSNNKIQKSYKVPVKLKQKLTPIEAKIICYSLSLFGSFAVLWVIMTFLSIYYLRLRQYNLGFLRTTNQGNTSNSLPCERAISSVWFSLILLFTPSIVFYIYLYNFLDNVNFKTILYFSAVSFVLLFFKFISLGWGFSQGRLIRPNP